MQDIIAKCKTEYAEISEQLQDPAIVNNVQEMARLGRRQVELGGIMEKITRLETVTHDMQGNAEIINNSDSDPELAEMALAENTDLATEKESLQKEIEVMLLPKDPNDDKDIIVEIRAGAGGDESALFAAQLFRMYTRFAEEQGWRVSVMHTSPTGIGGMKEVIFEVDAGSNSEPVYALLKFESGVHRVQRIPETEKQGRIHTSTATVAVLPKAEEVDVVIDPKDLRIDTFASSGPGGQSVNTTMSAVRITHIPTGIVASCQDGKSQHKNKEQAMSVLRARILQAEQDARDKELGDARRSQIGTGDRSEKIRTYNVPQDRITDHRIKQNWSNVSGILDGALTPITDALREEDVKLKMQAQ
jgi:peptide chain release factor 1